MAKSFNIKCNSFLPKHLDNIISSLGYTCLYKVIAWPKLKGISKSPNPALYKQVIIPIICFKSSGVSVHTIVPSSFLIKNFFSLISLDISLKYCL